MGKQEKRESDASLIKTTSTMRNKAAFVGRCFLNILKLTRLFGCTKSSIKEQENYKKKPGNVSTAASSN